MTICEVNQQLATASGCLDRASAAIRTADQALAEAETLIRMTLQGSDDQHLVALVAHIRQQLTTAARSNADSTRATEAWIARIGGTASPGKPLGATQRRP